MAKAASTSGISPPKYECAECRDTGFTHFEDENGYRFAKRCKCHEWRQLRKHKANSNIESRFKHCSLDSYNPWSESTKAAKRKALEFVEAFRGGGRTSIAFLGSVGAGKTHLGIGILQALISGKVGVLYTPYREMVNRLKQNVMDEEAYYHRLGVYTNVNVLFIDDLYKGVSFQHGTPTDLKYVFDVVNDRYNNDRSTIITSEFNLERLCRADEATGSRILEMCEPNIHVFAGDNENYRLRNLIRNQP